MNFEPAEKMKNFEAGIFQILDEKKKELQKQGKKTAAQYLYSCVRTRFRKTAKSRMIRSLESALSVRQIRIWEAMS